MLISKGFSKDSTKKIARTVIGIQQSTGYKINVQKSVAFLYTNNEGAEKETKESIPFAITLKTIGCLGISLTKM